MDSEKLPHSLNLTLSPMEGDDMQRKNRLEGSMGGAMTLQLKDFGSVGIRTRDRYVGRPSEMGIVDEKRYGQIRARMCISCTQPDW